jgi:predicted class III extradiol MEMO1 family dioxygenase
MWFLLQAKLPETNSYSVVYPFLDSHARKSGSFFIFPVVVDHQMKQTMNSIAGSIIID